MKMNKRYTDLLFDVDDTLLDFKAAERYSLGQIFDELSLAPFDEVYETYHTISQGLWDASELGLLSVDDVVSQRFGKLLRHYGLTGDGEAIDRQFRSPLFMPLKDRGLGRRGSASYAARQTPPDPWVWRPPSTTPIQWFGGPLCPIDVVLNPGSAALAVHSVPIRGAVSQSQTAGDTKEP